MTRRRNADPRSMPLHPTTPDAPPFRQRRNARPPRLDADARLVLRGAKFARVTLRDHDGTHVHVFCTLEAADDHMVVLLPWGHSGARMRIRLEHVVGAIVAALPAAAATRVSRAQRESARTRALVRRFAAREQDR